MIFTDLFSKDMCHVCGQTPCNCTHIAESVAEGTGNIGPSIKTLFQKIYDQGDDEIEYFYYESPVFAQYWDKYEGDIDSIVAEVDPKELQIIHDELEAYVEGAGLAEEKVRLDPKCWKGKKIGNPKTKMKGGVRVNNCVPAEGVEENYDNGEYSDEAGMAHGNLITIAKAARGLLDTIDQHEDLPEWVQEKIAKVEGMLVSAWNYLQSQEAQGIDPRVSEMYANLAENWQRVSHRLELNQEFDMIESIVESIARRNGVDAETVWADLESLTEDELYVFAVTSEPIMEDWQKANKRDKTDGMSRKAVKAYRREHPGSKLQTAVTTKPSKLKKGSKASKRRKSYCSRSRGQMKMHNISCAKTPDKAICKARRRWNCEGVEFTQTMLEGEVVPFKRAAQSWQKLPRDVLTLANDWFWADYESGGLQATMDPKGLGSGIANQQKYLGAQLQQRGWAIDIDDEFENVVLKNRQGQTILLPIEDAQDFTGWAQGTNPVNEQGVAEGLDRLDSFTRKVLNRMQDDSWLSAERAYFIQKGAEQKMHTNREQYNQEIQRFIDLYRQYKGQQGVAEGDKLTGTPVVSLKDFGDKDNTKDRYGRTVPKKLKKDDPRVRFHKDYSQHEKKLIGKMSNAEKADKGWRNPNVDEGVAEGSLNEISADLISRARDAAGRKWAAADDRKDKKASKKYNAQDSRLTDRLNAKKAKEQGVAEADDPKFVGFMNKAMANKVDAPKADPLAKAPDWYKNAPAMNFDSMPSHKKALQFGLKVLSKLDPETKQQLAAGGEQAIVDYLVDVSERTLGARGTIDFVEEDIWECQDYLSNVFHDPNITSWVDVLKTGLNEVSDATLTSYLTKVDADARKHRADPTKRPAQKRNRSVSGFARAFNKLDARKEKVDEISKQKLGDYLHAAHQDVVDRATSSSFQSGQAGDKYNRADVSPKEKQRQAGMARAVSRLTRENSMADELAQMAMKRNPKALVRVDGKTLQSPAPGPKPAGTAAPRPAPRFDPEAEYSDDYSVWHRRTKGLSEGSSIAEAWARRYPNLNSDIAECKYNGDSERLQRLLSIKNIIDSDSGIKK